MKLESSARFLPRMRFGALLVVVFLDGTLACNERFEFDVPDRDSGVVLGTPSAAPESSGETEKPRPPPPSVGVDAALAPTPSCARDSDCPLALHCDSASGMCFECNVDTNCETAAAPRCDATLHRCVACAVDQHCAEGWECDPVVRICRQRCRENHDCSTEHGCDRRQGLCIECDEDYECERSAEGALCSVAGTGCVECRSAEHCPVAQLCDPLSGRCVDCRNAQDCENGELCDPANHECVAASSL